MLILLAMCGLAVADDEPRLTGHEVIEIEGAPPTPKVQAKPKKRYLGTGSDLDNIFLRPAPEYSDEAVLSDAWELAWVLLDIDATGAVTRVKFLKVPGHDLEKLAVKTAMKLQFEPAIGDDGKPIRSWIVWPIEWPSYWWLVQFTGLATGIPIRATCRAPGQDRCTWDRSIRRTRTAGSRTGSARTPRRGGRSSWDDSPSRAAQNFTLLDERRLWPIRLRESCDHLPPAHLRHARVCRRLRR